MSTLPKRSKDVDNDIGTLNLGLSHDWTQQTYTLPMSFQDTITFLTRKVKEYESSLTSRKLSIPRKTCGTIYSISFLRKDQRCVMAVVVHSLFQWLYAKTYNPLRMTVSGVAGSGKSTLIQTVVATVRTMFQQNDVVYVCAPTGSAAFSAGGETIHRLFGIRVNGITEN